MATYDCVQDYGQQPGTDYITQSAQWAVMVFRFRYPATYSRLLQSSFTTNYPPAVEIRGNPLIITSDCLQLQVSQQKSQYTMQMGAVLAPGLNYITEIFPGDWVMAWMLTNDQDYKDLVNRMQGVSAQGGVPLNGFRDGLKFVGRVSAIRKSLDQGGDGHRSVRYNLTGVGFQEMDSQIFYDPLLADRVDALGLLWGRLNADINKFVTAQQTGIDINKALPAIIDLMLGEGIPPNLSHGDSDPRLRSTSGSSESHLADASDPKSKFAYAIPTVVAQCLNVQGTTPNGITRYADILETTIGIQSYSTASAGPVQGTGPQGVTQQGPNADKAIATNFMPSNLGSTGTRRQCTLPLLGVMLPQAPQFTNVPLWSILNQFLNPAINEMYMCLRVNQDGFVKPTFIARQFPFTTDKFNLGLDEGQPVTRYLSLPSWGIDPVMVNHVDVGRSDALRFNFIHVYGNAGSPKYDPGQIIFNPPIRDDIDIARSGLRPYMSTVPCHVSSVQNHDAGKWMAVLSDFLMGQHMTLTGNLNCIGIQAPVCVGDNLEWDGDVYHIESLQHSCGIDASGHKSFTTSFSLSHGLRADRLVDGGGAPDTGIYADVIPSDQTDLDPGFTVDTSQPAADQSQTPGNVSTEKISS